MPPLAVFLATPQVNQKRVLLRASQALTISRLDAVLSGGTNPSVSIALRHGTDVAAAGTAVMANPITVTSTTTGNAITSVQTPDIPAGDWLWLEVTAVTGAPEGLTVSVALQ